MTTSRREFLASSALAAAALAAAPLSRALAIPARSGPLRILILGGTGFLGPAIVEAAQAKNYHLTLFNRGKREKTKGTSFDGVEKLLGNRDPLKHSDEKDPDSPLGLSQIHDAIKAGTTWDAVIDTSGYFPRHVKASAELLAKAASQYLFISTVSVYAANDRPGADETDALGLLANPDVEDMGASQENYGPLKALCEKAAEAAFPAKATNIRPGFIVGVRDDTDRFTYWPVRASQGGDMLVPGAPADPVQFIDVRDLAAFVLTCIERKHFGVFNVTGPAQSSTWGQTMDAVAAARPALADKPLTQTWVPADFLAGQGVALGAQLAIYIPPEGDAIGFHQRSIAKALAAGLTTRPTVDTCKEILAWWPTELERRVRVTKETQDAAIKRGDKPPTMPDPTKLRTGITPEREVALIKAFKESQPKK